ncbi:MAG TPA: type II CAAX endopeptidase family protein [Ureibacillus sp.]|nr:type II CAAX endopeptidase family protein [Ureibacillus sp.]
MSYYAKVLLGFIVLDLYLNIGIARSSELWIQVILVLLFFPILKVILKLTKVNNYQKIGINFQPNWTKNLMFGFLIGFAFWLVKYVLQYISHGFEITGIQPFPEMLITLIIVLLMFFVGSFLNDVIIRGYIFGHLKGKIPMKWIFLISVVIYALDDMWNEGFSLWNTLFSLVLGLSLTYAIYKTGSIWLTTGIHWGLNVCYGIFNGALGSASGGIILTQNYSPTILTEFISYLIALSMFLLIYLMRNRMNTFE